jgi:hypothetical protein
MARRITILRGLLYWVFVKVTLVTPVLSTAVTSKCCAPAAIAARPSTCAGAVHDAVADACACMGILLHVGGCSVWGVFFVCTNVCICPVRLSLYELQQSLDMGWECNRK